MDGLESLELKISKFLRSGVMLSAFFMLVGWIFYLLENGTSFDLLKIYHEKSLFKTLELAISTNSWGQLATYLGLSILISLPITRVFLTGFLFLKQKEFILASMAFFVFIVLIISFTLGIEL